jgi:hypothetical protein
LIFGDAEAVNDHLAERRYEAALLHVASELAWLGSLAICNHDLFRLIVATKAMIATMVRNGSMERQSVDDRKSTA